MKKIILTILALLILAVPCFGALEFNSTNQYVDVGEVFADGSWSEITIAALVNTTSTSAPAMVYASYNKSTVKGMSFAVSKGRIGFDNLADLHNRYGWTYNNPSENLQNKVIVLTVKYDAGWSMKCWLDGADITAKFSPGSANEGTVTTIRSGIASHCIGSQANPTTERSFDGILGDVRIYNKFMSEAEAKTICFSHGNDNIVDGLVGRWLMDEKPDGTSASGANSVIDISGNGNHGTPYNSPIYRSAPVTITRPHFH